MKNIQKTFPSSRHFTKLLLPVLLLLITACTSTSVNDNRTANVESTDTVTGSNDNLLQSLLAQGDISTSPQREQILYRASLLLRNFDRDNDALLLLETLDTDSVPLELAINILLLKSQLYAKYDQPQLALRILRNERVHQLPRLYDSLQLAVHLFKADLYEENIMYLESAQARIQADQLLPRSMVPLNHEHIWNALNTITANQLQTLSEQERRFEFQGWYELAVIGKAYQYNLDRQVVELAAWRAAWTRHPAAIYLPQALQLVETMAEERPDTIALLLPLSTLQGKVIRDGFMSAYYDVIQFGGKVPEVRLYNTSDSIDILQDYNRAVADGAAMVIGPLLKQHVARLYSELTLPVPTLALNNIEDSQPSPESLYQFALSPANEAVQIAERAWRDGHRYAAILSPEFTQDDFYLRKRNSFIDHWLMLGGDIVAEESYREDYTDIVEALLDIDDSETRKENLSDMIREQIEFTQRRRQDIDFIFLIAEPGPARQINPTLAYLYAGDVPVYASQDIYSGIPRPLVDNDLNGIIFGDSPWLLNFNDELKDKVNNLFPQNTALTLRLQAFGIDAFRLYPRLKQLEEVPDSQIYGATGLLKLGANRSIVRELSWARVTDGFARAENQAP